MLFLVNFLEKTPNLLVFPRKYRKFMNLESHIEQLFHARYIGNILMIKDYSYRYKHDTPKDTK